MLVNLPYKILVEKRLGGNLDSVLKDMGLGKKCMMICPPNLSVLPRFEKLLASFSVSVVENESVEKDNFEKLSAAARKHDFVIGLGGGRAIDAAKYTAFLAKKKWVAIPTILSHDGVVSSRAIINSNGAKISVEAKEPEAIIAELDTIKNAPYRYTAAGAGDLISNLSAVEDWRIADNSGKEEYHTVIANLSLLSADAAIKHCDEIKNQEYHGLEILLWSLICSGFAMNIYGSSRPCSGSEHNISHALDALGTKALHGEQVALASIATTYLQAGNWERIRNVMKGLGLPVTAEGLGIERETMIKAMAHARHIRKRYTILNKYSISEKKAESILKKTGIIRS